MVQMQRKNSRKVPPIGGKPCGSLYAFALVQMPGESHV